MTTASSPYSMTIMFLPISPTPPSGITRNGVRFISSPSLPLLVEIESILSILLDGRDASKGIVRIDAADLWVERVARTSPAVRDRGVWSDGSMILSGADSSERVSCGCWGFVEESELRGMGLGPSGCGELGVAGVLDEFGKLVKVPLQGHAEIGVSQGCRGVIHGEDDDAVPLCGDAAQLADWLIWKELCGRVPAERDYHLWGNQLDLAIQIRAACLDLDGEGGRGCWARGT